MSHVALWVLGKALDLLSMLTPRVRKGGDDDVCYHSPGCRHQWHLDTEGEALEPGDIYDIR